MIALRRLSYAALALAFFQIVFGAVVRITGSGWGCGHHWPKCDGRWFPPLERTDLIIEVTHRYLALGLTLAVAALAFAAWRRRSMAGIAGRGGVLRPAVAGLAVVMVTALLGMATIKSELAPLVVVAHLALAMALLAVLSIAVLRAGGFGAAAVTPSPTAGRTWRAARVAAILAFVVIVLGALVANLGAAGACLGFPHCRVFTGPNQGLLHLQLTHRVVAFLFAFHVLGIVIALRRRTESPVVKRAALVALLTVVAQILIAAALVETRLPPVLRSLHQAVGALVWIAIVVFAALAKRAADGLPARRPAPAPLAEPLPSSGAVTRMPAITPTGSSVIIETPRSEPDVVARMAETERAARAYEAAMIALVATAETAIPADEESDVPDEAVIATLPEGIQGSAEPAVTAEPRATGEQPAPASEPTPEPGPGPDEPAAVADAGRATGGEPVVVPDGVATPGTPDPAVATPKRAHSVAVIVARGADL